MPAAQGDIAVRHCLLERLDDARRRSDTLFALVHHDAKYERPIPERHRIVFYVGHLEAFDWNLLRENALGLKSFHPQFDRLFAFGIDPVDGGLPSDQPSDWPSPQAVHEYVSRTRVALDEKLDDRIRDSSAHTHDEFPLDTLLNVAIEHRLMHLETLAYMLHQLPLDRKIPQVAPSSLVAPPVTHRMVEVPEGTASLGLYRSDEKFGWDNEYDAHTLQVHGFEIDQYKVTNRQYLDFMNAGGYGTRSLWDSDAWDWKTARGVSHPVFWKRSGEQWLCRTMFEEIPLPLDWPVYVSHAEATAYARWAGKSLPTEQEWQRAAYGAADGKEGSYLRGGEAPDSRLGNFDFARWDPLPVNAFPNARTAFNVHGILGNGWEWTSTIFAPFPGFKAFPFYPGYSANFFDGRHFVMKGGSARTAACMLRPTFRNWFQAHYQYVYAGFRCVSR